MSHSSSSSSSSHKSSWSSSSSEIEIPDFHLTQKKLINLRKKGNSIIDFDGSSLSETLFFLYLFRKYAGNKSCILFDEQASDFEWGVNISLDFTGKLINSEALTVQTERISTLFVNCLQKETELIIIPIYLGFLEYDDSVNSHRNLLIFRKRANTIEHYEPHGHAFKLQPNSKTTISIQNNIFKLVQKINSKIPRSNDKIEFITADNSCPYIRTGFQQLEGNSTLPLHSDLEPQGYCVAWNLFMLEMSLLNPTLSLSEIQNQIIRVIDKSSKLRGDNLRLIIRGYAHVITDKIFNYFSRLFETQLSMAIIKKLEIENPLKYQDFILKLREFIKVFNNNMSDSELRRTINSETVKTYETLLEMRQSNLSSNSDDSNTNSNDSMNSPKKQPMVTYSNTSQKRARSSSGSSGGKVRKLRKQTQRKRVLKKYK